MNYEPNLGLYDMRRDTEGLPTSLANKINNTICMKGGGGGGSTTYTGIDPEFKPYLEKVLSDVTGRYEADVKGGPDAIVAKMTPEQLRALEQQKRIGEQKLAGTGAFDTSAANEAALKKVMGTGMGAAASGGALGSARSQMALNKALAETSGEQQRERLKTMQEGVSDIGKVGTTLQKYQQERLDAPHTSAERYFGYLSGAPQQSKVEQSGGGK
jgi:hypothetical protein